MNKKPKSLFQNFCVCLSKENAVLSPLGWVLSWVPQGWGGDVSLIILRLGTWGVWDLEKCPTEGSSQGRAVWLGSAGPGRWPGPALTLRLCSQRAGPGREGSPRNSNLLTLGTVSRIPIMRIIRTLLAAKDKNPTQMSLRIKERKPGREKGGGRKGTGRKQPRGSSLRSPEEGRLQEPVHPGLLLPLRARSLSPSRLACLLHSPSP